MFFPAKLAVFGLVLLAWVQAGRAVDTNLPALFRSGPVFEQAEKIRRLSSEQASLHYPVLLRGVITYTDGFFNTFVQDESAGIYIFINPKGTKTVRTDIRAGQRVEVRGFTVRGDFAPAIEGMDGRAVDIQILGEGEFPLPQPVPAELSKQVALDGQWVEAAGVIRRVTRRDTRAQVILQVAGKTIPLLLPGYGDEKPLPLSLLGARVRAQGVLGFLVNKERQMTGIRIYVPTLKQIQLEKVTEDIFQKPVREASSLLHFSLTAEENMVRLAGVVTLVVPGSGFYLRDRTAGIWVQSEQETKLALGDTVDVVGFPDSQPVKPGLVDAVFRVTGRQALPAPVRLEDFSQLEDRLKDELVSLDAIVVESQSGKTGTGFVLQSGDRLFQCRLVGHHAAAQLPANGSVVRVTGVYAANGAEGMVADTHLPMLLLHSSNDLCLLSEPSWFTPGRLRMALFFFGLVIGISVVAIAGMRHQIRRQTKAIIQHSEQAAIQIERTRIARDWHDSLGQQLVGLGLQLDTARHLVNHDPAAANATLEVAVAMLRHSHEEARHSIWHLHASELEQVGLAEALRRLVRESSPPNGKPQIIFEVSGVIGRLTLTAESHLFRVAQEAVANALRHAQAGHIWVRLDFSPDSIRLTVRDDGRGFSQAATALPAAEGIGLLSLRQRAVKAGGSLILNSQPGKGVEVQVEIQRAPAT